LLSFLGPEYNLFDSLCLSVCWVNKSFQIKHATKKYSLILRSNTLLLKGITSSLSQDTFKVKRYKPAKVNAPSREINSLLPGQLDTSFAIDDYLALVQKAIKQDVLILPTNYSFVFRKDFVEAKSVFQNAARKLKKSEGAVQRFLIPCWNSSHWYFIEVNTRRREMSCYN